MPAALLPLLPLALAVAIFIVLGIVRRRGRSPVSNNYCPHSNPVLGNLIPFLLNRSRFLDWAADLLAASPSGAIEIRGPLLLTRGVAVSSSSAVDHITRTYFSRFPKSSRISVAFADFLGNGIFATDGPIWMLQRKAASVSFTSRSLRRFIGRVVREQINNRLLPLLDDAASAGVAVDMQDLLRKFAFDNICAIAFGIDQDTLRVGDERHRRFFDAFHAATEISFARLFEPLPLTWKIKKLLNVGSERRLRDAVTIVDDYVISLIEQKEASMISEGGRGDEEKHPDLLSRFAAALAEDGAELGALFRSPAERSRFLRDIVVSFMLAGKDATSSALTWLFWLLGANPHCEQRIRDEIARQQEDEDDDGREYYERLKAMHYLHAAITEAMRLYPPVPINSRAATADDVLPDGTIVRAGWFTDYCAYAMARDERIWGTDCGQFRPERWLTASGEFVAVEPSRYPVFHAGPRSCLGKDMAYMQMKAVAMAVLGRYRLQVAAETGGASMSAPPAYELSATLRMSGGLWVRVNVP